MNKSMGNSEHRKQALKDMLKKLHEGQSVDDVKEQFETTFGDVAATEIAAVEQMLIAEGVPVEEIQKLCDVHAAVFKGSVEEIHRETDPRKIPGHPANVLIKENRALERLIEEEIRPALALIMSGQEKSGEKLHSSLEKLQAVELHYLKKENLIFPYMEKHDITAPPKVMWGVDDEIRMELKDAISTAKNFGSDESIGVEKLDALVSGTLLKLTEMIFKEEEIMLPMIADVFSDEEWGIIASESAGLGYSLISAPPLYAPKADEEKKVGQKLEGGITLPTGAFDVKELEMLLNTLPIDITYVGADNRVKYFSQSSERIFARTKAIIGREVSNCHPPASVDIVEKIIEDFRSGVKDEESFWIPLGDKFVYIRYFAVRDENLKYLGVLEVTQDIAPIMGIKGEKRLMSED